METKGPRTNTQDVEVLPRNKPDLFPSDLRAACVVTYAKEGLMLSLAVRSVSIS